VQPQTIIGRNARFADVFRAAHRSPLNLLQSSIEGGWADFVALHEIVMTAG
jgi:hypothetical protein